MQTGLYIVSVLMTITIYFVCALSGSADICKAFAEFLMISSNVISQTRDFLSKWISDGGSLCICFKICWKSRRAKAAAEQGQAEGTVNFSHGNFLF